MISVHELPKIHDQQLLHADRIELIYNDILKSNSKGLEVVSVPWELTANEVAYFKLYGYRVIPSKVIGDFIFWTHA